jgi:polar amino acid transport system substrate-binding protein
MRMRFGILLFLMAIAWTVASHAEKIKMATGEWMPFTSEKMEDFGDFTRSVTLVFREMGLEPEYVFYPWRRCYDSVIKGKVWAAFPYSYTERRAEEVWFTNPLSYSKTLFFYYSRGDSSKKDYAFRSLEDLKSYRIGGVTGYFYEDSFEKAGLNVDYVNKEISGLEKLMKGRIDLMPMNDLVGWRFIRAHFPDDADHFKTLPKPLSIDPLHLIVSRAYPQSKELLHRFNSALKRCVDKSLIQIEKSD